MLDLKTKGNILEQKYYDNITPLFNNYEELSAYITFNKLLPYNREDISKVLLVGHSPKVRTDTSISETLDLNYGNNLKRYITREILSPLRIKIEECSAKKM